MTEQIDNLIILWYLCNIIVTVYIVYKIFNKKETLLKIEVQLRHPDAKMPTKSHDSDAAYDIYAISDADIPPGIITNIDSGLAMVVPRGYYLTVNGRSSLYKVGINPSRGLIDSGYTGNMIISLMSISKDSYHISKGDRIAQISVHEVLNTELNKVNKISPEYDIRGNNGFGSSGK